MRNFANFGLVIATTPSDASMFLRTLSDKLKTLLKIFATLGDSAAKHVTMLYPLVISALPEET